MTAPRRRLGATAERALFTVLFLAAVALLGYLSQRHSLAVDWTASGRNTLSPASAALLERMPGRIHVRAFVSGDDRLREAVRQLVDRYRRSHPRITLEFINPQREPRETERFGVRQDGELVVEYEDRRRRVQGLSEALLSNALARLARESTRWVAYTSGHGERDLLGGARGDLGEFGRHLQSLGFNLQPLAADGPRQVPDNVAVLVVAQPAQPWPDAVAARVSDWIAAGGNLLWLADPGGTAPPALARSLGVTPEPGLLVDPSSRLNGQPTPEFVLVTGYASHPATAGLDPFTAFPTATSLAWEARDGWQVRGIAATGLRAWRETGDLDRAVRFDDGADAAGPLDLAVALERPRPAGGSQRVMVFGDADFLSNAYLGLGANRALGSNAMNWLSGDDMLVDVPVFMAPDLDFAPGQAERAVIALGPGLALPLALLAFGLARWRRRNR